MIGMHCEYVDSAYDKEYFVLWKSELEKGMVNSEGDGFPRFSRDF